MAIITDSSFVYALYNQNDALHHQAMNFASEYTENTIIPNVILPEVSFLFLRDLGYRGVQQFLESFKNINARLEPLEIFASSNDSDRSVGQTLCENTTISFIVYGTSLHTRPFVLTRLR